MHNGAANVSHLSDAAGTITQRYQFDAFGSITFQSGTTTNNYRFQTKEFHPKSNLVYFGARWYNPAIGRWITPDPLGIIDGPNIYIYLNNNPLNDIDPWGLCEGVSWWEKLEEIIEKLLDAVSIGLIIGDIVTIPSGEGIGPAAVIQAGKQCKSCNSCRFCA